MLEFIKTIISGIKTFLAGEIGKSERKMMKSVQGVQQEAQEAYSYAGAAMTKALGAQSSARDAYSYAGSAATTAARALPDILITHYDNSNPLINWDGVPGEMVKTNTFVRDSFSHTFYKIPNVSVEDIQKAYDRFADIKRSIMTADGESDLSTDGNIATSGNCKWSVYLLVATEAGTYSITYGYTTSSIEVPEPGVYVCIRTNGTKTFHTVRVVVPKYTIQVEAKYHNVSNQYRTLRFRV